MVSRELTNRDAQARHSGETHAPPQHATHSFLSIQLRASRRTHDAIHLIRAIPRMASPPKAAPLTLIPARRSNVVAPLVRLTMYNDGEARR